MASTLSFERLKDVLLEHILRDIKGLQNDQSDEKQMEDAVTLTNRHCRALCEHFDRILLHGLKSAENGYWSFISYFTRSEAIQIINQLHTVKTGIGRGRAWLYLALNEQSLESYVRMFMDNQDYIQNYYLRESFLRDLERLVVLQTLVSGLDYIAFDLPIESFYLDYGATKDTSTVGSLKSGNITPDVDPSFISSVSPEREVKVQQTPSDSPSDEKPSKEPFFLTGIISSVFGKDKKESLTASSPGKTEEKKLREPSPLGAGQQGVEGGVVSDMTFEKEGELRDSLSPHRLLSQTGDQASSQVESHSGSFSSYSGSNVLGKDEQLEKEKKVEEEEDLVVRKPKKNKGKKKKKKKKKENDDPVQSQRVSSDISVNVDKNQVDTVVVEGHGNQRVDPLLHSGRLEEEIPVVDNATLERSMDQQTTSEGTGSKEEIRPIPTNPFDPTDLLSEYVEECDTAFGRSVEPLPLTQSSKRLSLADELEQAMDQLSTNEGKEEGSGEGDKSWEAMGEILLPSINLNLTSSSNESDARDIVASYHDETDAPYSSQAKTTPITHDADTPPVDSAPSISAEHSSTSLIEKASEKGSDSPTDLMTHSNSPNRPHEISQKDREANDVLIDDNTKVVISLDVLHQEEEEILRLIQVSTPTGVGQQQNCYVLITSQSAYIMKKDGIQGHYSCEIGIKFPLFEHIVIGLGWQSLVFVYQSSLEGPSMLKKYIILTGSEAVSRSIVDSIRKAAASCPGFNRSIPLNKDDEPRIDAIEKELIKLGSETSMEIVQYLLVDWEQLSGDPPLITEGVVRSGTLLVKTTNLLGIQSWRQAFFVFKKGSMFQFSNEEEDIPKNVFHMKECGGCTRAMGEGKQFAFSILGKDGTVMAVLAASNEEELTQWMQTLIEAAVLEKEPTSPSLRKTCFSCALLLTQNKIHILQEDWTNQSVQLVASCGVLDVNDVRVDSSLPLYCTISYDQKSYDQRNNQGVWLICFNKEFELGKFETALSGMWKEEFQVDLQFSEVTDVLTQQRAHKAVELMQGSKFRSDSMTRGRTEFTYSNQY